MNDKQNYSDLQKNTSTDSLLMEALSKKITIPEDQWEKIIHNSKHLKDKYKICPLEKVFINKIQLSEKILTLLIENFNCNITNEISHTPLMTALNIKTKLPEEIWEKLIEKTNFYEKNKFDKTALTIAIINNSKLSTKIWHLLIDKTPIPQRKEAVIHALRTNPSLPEEIWYKLLNNDFINSTKVLHIALIFGPRIPEKLWFNLFNGKNLTELDENYNSFLTNAIDNEPDIHKELWEKLFETFHSMDKKTKQKTATSLTEAIYYHNFNKFTPNQNIQILNHLPPDYKFEFDNIKVQKFISNYIEKIKKIISDFEIIQNKTINKTPLKNKTKL
jgi:hypothetical protein